MVSVSASVNLPLHQKVQFSSGTGSPEWSQKKGRKTVVCVSVLLTMVAGHPADKNCFNLLQKILILLTCTMQERKLAKQKLCESVVLILLHSKILLQWTRL